MLLRLSRFFVSVILVRRVVIGVDGVFESSTESLRLLVRSVSDLHHILVVETVPVHLR